MTKKIKREDLGVIFSSKERRGRFVEEYEYFDADGNLAFYKNYVLSNYKTDRTEVLIELMELSIKAGFFSLDFHKHSWSLFFDKRFWYRLAFLDYTFSLRDDIGYEWYKKVNNTILDHVSNLEIRFQAAMNLFVFDAAMGEPILKMILSAGKRGNHYVFYRMGSFLQENKGRTKYKAVKESFIEILKNGKVVLPMPQKKELLSKVS